MTSGVLPLASPTQGRPTILLYTLLVKVDLTMTALPGLESGVERLQRLLMASSHGDQGAFSELYNLTRSKLFGIAIRILRRSDVAEDVLQEAYVRIWRNAASYKPTRGSPITWMVTIVRNLAIDIVRRPAIEADSDDFLLLGLPGDQESALDGIQASEERLKAFIALQALDTRQRHLIIAAYVHGESREKLAARFGKPVSTIKTWLRRAVLEAQASLRDAVSEHSPAYCEFGTRDFPVQRESAVFAKVIQEPIAFVQAKATTIEMTACRKAKNVSSLAA